MNIKNFVASLLFLPVMAFAQVDTSGLTQAQVDTLKRQAAEMKSPQNMSKEVREEVSAWGELGAGMGKAVVAGAREVGTAANEFAGTTLGKVTMAVVVYKVIGQDVLGVLFGSVILVVGFSIGIWLLMSAKCVEYETKEVPVMWGMFTVTKKTVIRKFSNNNSESFIISGVFSLLFTTVISAFAIF